MSDISNQEREIFVSLASGNIGKGIEEIVLDEEANNQELIARLHDSYENGDKSIFDTIYFLGHLNEQLRNDCEKILRFCSSHQVTKLDDLDSSWQKKICEQIGKDVTKLRLARKNVLEQMPALNPTTQFQPY